MHEVEVEVLEAEVVQGSEARVPHVFLTVVGVPQLARHPKVVAGDGRVLRQRGSDAGANLALVAVVARAVEVPPPLPDGRLHERRRLLLGDFPGPETEEGHARTRAKDRALGYAGIGRVVARGLGAQFIGRGHHRAYRRGGPTTTRRATVEGEPVRELRADARGGGGHGARQDGAGPQRHEANISPPREPDVSEIDSGQKKRNADSLFSPKKYLGSGARGAHFATRARRHHRTRPWTRGPADATRATYTTDRNGASSRIRTPRASPRPRPRAPPPEFRNDFR